MIQSMGLATDAETGWITAATAYLRGALAEGSLVGAVVDGDHGSLVSCGVIEFKQRIPSSWNPSGTYAYISTMATEPLWRRRGCARAILNELLSEARVTGVAIVSSCTRPPTVHRSIELSGSPARSAGKRCDSSSRRGRDMSPTLAPNASESGRASRLGDRRGQRALQRARKAGAVTMSS